MHLSMPDKWVSHVRVGEVKRQTYVVAAGPEGGRIA